MTIALTSWFDGARDGARRLGRSHLATQAAILLPVIVIAGLTAWTVLSGPTNARSRDASLPAQAGAQGASPPQQTASLVNPASSNTETALSVTPDVPPAGQAAPIEPPAVNGLKILAQSWRRGGLGSNALVTFTLRNENGYAVRDIEIACAFSRQDGSHLTDRKRVIPDAVVSMRSRRIFSQMHIGFVNVYANKAKCVPIAANRI
jgi:hypothetical protein